MEAEINAGGLVGYNDGILDNVYSAVTVVSTGKNIGGLVGYNNNIIKNSRASGSVTGNGAVGGLVGANNGTITDSSSRTVAINGRLHRGQWRLYRRRACGLQHPEHHWFLFQLGGDRKRARRRVGRHNAAKGSITGNAQSSGSVVGLVKHTSVENKNFDVSVGGLVGYNEGSIDGAISDAPVISDGMNVGGLVGSNNSSGKVTNSKARVSVTGNALSEALRVLIREPSASRPRARS